MLPPELIERILLLLDLKFVLTCRLINREFNEIIQSSTILQYFLACEAAGVIDNPRSPLSFPERLEALEKREDAWKKLNPTFETTIKVKHQPSAISVYGLTGGAYLLDDDNLKDLYYCPLPSSIQDNPRWIRIPAHPEQDWPGTFVNFALSEYEHDLMINVVSSNIGDQLDMQQPEYSIDLVLLKFSTGEYHPLARRPRIHVQKSDLERPCLIPRIVGDNLALVTCPDTLFIFDWKTGHRRLQHDPIENAYSDLVFISPELLLVPNLVLFHFEVWHIPPSHPNPNPPVQVLSLRIPDISPDYYLLDVGCSGMPNPFLDSMPYFPPRPFFSSPESSIVTVNLTLASLRETNVSYTLVMHRSALLDTIKKWTSPSLIEQQLDLPIWLTNEVTAHKRADPDDGFVRLDVQSRLLSMKPHYRSSPPTRGSLTFATFPTSHTSDITTNSSAISFTTSSDSEYDFRRVRWADWGPPISRLLEVSDSQAQLIGTSAGQRYAFTIPSPHDTRKLMISVADFNPYHVRRNAERMARLRGEEEDGGDNCDNQEGRMKNEQLEKLAHQGAFSEDVYMGLKCVVYHAQGEYEFEQLLMDEERLVGLKLDDNGRDEFVKVLYIG